MFIDYVYIYNNSTQQVISLSLSNKFLCNFNSETLKYTKRKNEAFVENLFGNNIKNITALVGKNGSGKTNTIKNFVNILTENIDKNIEYLINCFDEETQEEWMITNIFKFIKRNPKYKYRKIKHLLNYTGVFYNSNVFDGNSIFESTKNVVNLSTNNLIRDYIKTDAPIKSIRDNEADGHIEFMILYKADLKIDDYIKLPKSIDIKINFGDFVKSTEDLSNYFNKQKLKVNLRDKIGLSDREYYINSVKNTYFFDYILWISELLKVINSTKSEYLSENEIRNRFKVFWEEIVGYLEIEITDIEDELYNEVIILNNVEDLSDYELVVDDITESINEILTRYIVDSRIQKTIINKFLSIFVDKSYKRELFTKDEVETLELISYDLEGDYSKFKKEYDQLIKMSLKKGLNQKNIEVVNEKLISLINRNLKIDKNRRDIKREIELKEYEYDLYNEFNIEEELIYQLELENLLDDPEIDNLIIEKEDLIDALERIINEKFEQIIVKIDLLESIINKIRFEELGNQVDLETPELKEFISQYPNDKVFIFNWRDMSSGEISFVSFLSRLYKAKKMINHKKDILLFIDEGELYFHPQWQKNYINLLIQALNGIFKENVIQIVMTSHSPFIITDLPDYAVHTLNESTISGVLEDLGLFKTFAANIQDLYTNAFFLTGGLTGDFAKNKVNTWIKEILTDNSLANLNYSYYYKAFNLIGEPIVRNRCLSILDNQRNEYLKSTEKVEKKRAIEEYKKIILRLEQEINETN